MTAFLKLFFYLCLLFLPSNNSSASRKEEQREYSLMCSCAWLLFPPGIMFGRLFYILYAKTESCTVLYLLYQDLCPIVSDFARVILKISKRKILLFFKKKRF